MSDTGLHAAIVNSTRPVKYNSEKLSLWIELYQQCRARIFTATTMLGLKDSIERYCLVHKQFVLPAPGALSPTAIRFVLTSFTER